MNRRRFLACAATAPWVCAARGAASPAPLKEYLEGLIRTGVIPGAALVASRRGREQWSFALGTCCLVEHRDAALTLATRHPLYSFSKLITGTVVAMAVSEGRLRYEDRVQQHIPEFRGGGKEAITLRHCLTHAAGLATVASRAVHDAEGWNLALEGLCSATVEWAPGSRTAYHGWSGAFLAAECVRRVLGGVSWAELCRGRLFGPLGARSLTYELPAGRDPVAVVPQPAAAKPAPATAAAAFGYAGQPGAGCFGTLADALRILHLHLHGGRRGSKTVIAPEVFREMHAVQYAGEIAAARTAGETPRHESWGLGPLLRGTGPSNGSHQWFGFAHQPEPRTFGHAGIDTLIGVGDPVRELAFVFATTHSPQPSSQTVPLRNEVTDRVFAALA